MLLLSDRDQLYIQLLKKLKERDHTYKELRDTFDISQNNLNKLISDINHIVGEPIIHIQKVGVRLSLHRHVSYDYCVSRILSQSLEYNLLEQIFFDESLSYLTLSLELFVSESTVRKVIARLNEKLATIGCTILTRPIRLEGDERNIRVLIFRLFKEKYGLSNTPFKEEEKQYIDQFYDLDLPVSHRIKSMQERLNFQLLSLIAYTREKNGHSISSVRKVEKALPLFLAFSNLLSRFSFFNIRKMPDEFSVKFLSKVFSVFLDAEFQEIGQEGNENLRNIEQFVDEVEKLFKFSITKDDKKKLCRDLYDGIFGYLSIDDAMIGMVIVNDDYLNFLDNVDVLVKGTIPIFQALYDKHIDPTKANYFGYTFYTLQMRLNHLFIDEIKKNLRVEVCIYVDVAFYYAEYVKTRIELEVGALAQVTVIESKSEVEQLIKNGKLVITNLLEEFDGENVICISNYFSYEILDEIIHWVREERRKALNELLIQAE